MESTRDLHHSIQYCITVHYFILILLSIEYFLWKKIRDIVRLNITPILKANRKLKRFTVHCTVPYAEQKYTTPLIKFNFILVRNRYNKYINIYINTRAQFYDRKYASEYYSEKAQKSTPVKNWILATGCTFSSASVTGCTFPSASATECTFPSASVTLI